MPADVLFEQLQFQGRRAGVCEDHQEARRRNWLRQLERASHMSTIVYTISQPMNQFICSTTIYTCHWKRELKKIIGEMAVSASDRALLPHEVDVYSRQG